MSIELIKTLLAAGSALVGIWGAITWYLASTAVVLTKQDSTFLIESEEKYESKNIEVYEDSDKEGFYVAKFASLLKQGEINKRAAIITAGSLILQAIYIALNFFFPTI